MGYEYIITINLSEEEQRSFRDTILLLPTFEKEYEFNGRTCFDLREKIILI
jgi:hypothetical protein